MIEGLLRLCMLALHLLQSSLVHVKTLLLQHPSDPGRTLITSPCTQPT